MFASPLMNSCNIFLVFIFLGTNASTSVQVDQKSLAEMKLTQEAKMKAGSYSVGMKRRLSVAIALIGDPKLVILDGPVHRIETSPFIMFL